MNLLITAYSHYLQTHALIIVQILYRNALGPPYAYFSLLIHFLTF
jgi:hypothetical protein